MLPIPKDLTSAAPPCPFPYRQGSHPVIDVYPCEAFFYIWMWQGRYPGGKFPYSICLFFSFYLRLLSSNSWASEFAFSFLFFTRPTKAGMVVLSKGRHRKSQLFMSFGAIGGNTHGEASFLPYHPTGRVMNMEIRFLFVSFRFCEVWSDCLVVICDVFSFFHTRHRACRD